ncbi:hypothetical protein [Photorhabdus luminescens]|uniref:hypothetical protein n=1 Tax=Photorhabdus luminescens TaxID=29488 RepID=UPI0020CC9F79|nr:hypothetical protein [Photorhabdus luminescens]
MECVAVDNNHLSVDQNRSRSEELVNCQGDSSCRTTVRDKYRQEYDQIQERIATCSGADQCVAVAKELRALQGDYSARMSEIQEKARMRDWIPSHRQKCGNGLITVSTESGGCREYE